MREPSGASGDVKGLVEARRMVSSATLGEQRHYIRMFKDDQAP